MNRNAKKLFEKNKELAEYFYSRGRYIETYKHYKVCLENSKKGTIKHTQIQECIDELIDSMISSGLHTDLIEMSTLINMKQL